MSLQRHATDATDAPAQPEPTTDGDPSAEDGFPRFYTDAYADVARALVITLDDTHLGIEAADEAMLRAYQRWEKISTYDNPGGWVYRVGLNWARSLHRRLARQVPLGALRHEPVTHLDVADPALDRAVAALSVKLRAVVVCRLLLDLTVAETAQALRIPQGTVKSRLHSALSTLESTLEDPR